MATHRSDGSVHPGWHWGPFTFRVPFYHTRIEWPELLQGVFVAGATGLGLVPLLMGEFGLGFREAVACIFIQSLLISSAPILFGEPYAPGWITPALPLALSFVLAQTATGGAVYATSAERFQVMTALSLDFAAILFVLGLTGLGRRFIEWIPDALKAGIIMGAAIAALKRVFVDDADKYLLTQPVSTLLAVGLCLVLTFSAPIQRLKSRYRPLAILAGLGLLPGFLAAALVGPFIPRTDSAADPPAVAQPQAAATASLLDESPAAPTDAGHEGPIGETPGLYEVEYAIEIGGLSDWTEWLLLVPPFADLYHKVSPFAIGWPSWDMFLAGMPLALMAYVILFGDLVTGNEVLRTAIPARPDEKIPVDVGRSHLSVGIRNVLMALFAPLFPTQGCLWTGVHVIVVQRWSEGRKAMDSLFSGISSYYVFGLPILYIVLPLVNGLKPLMGIALSLTLVLTGFACAYVAMAIPKTPVERGVVLLTAVALAVFAEQPWIGLVVGLLATFTLVGPGVMMQRKSGDPKKD